MSLPQFSPKRIREIQSGKRNTNGTLKVSVKDLREKQDAKTKAIRAAIFGEPKKGKSDKSKAMELADKWFSQFIRLRDSDATGRVKCVTCSHTAHWKQLQCGHFVTRGHMATRYDEQNSNAQCRGCNYNGGQHLKHATAIDAKHGEGTAKGLEDKGRLRCSRTLSDLQFMADCYRLKVEHIRTMEPGKFLP